LNNRQPLTVNRELFRQRRRASLPLRKLPDLMRLCGNLAPLQWLARSMGFDMYEDAKSKRRAELQEELARLKRAA
jgi:hypothetical protein